VFEVVQICAKQCDAFSPRVPPPPPRRCPQLLKETMGKTRMKPGLLFDHGPFESDLRHSRDASNATHAA